MTYLDVALPIWAIIAAGGAVAGAVEGVRALVTPKKSGNKPV